jgi:hypothetical protein
MPRSILEEHALSVDTVPAKTDLLWWQERGLSFTRSGYGSAIPTRRMVYWHGHWRRVYCTIYSNAGTCWVRLKGAKHIVGNYMLDNKAEVCHAPWGA